MRLLIKNGTIVNADKSIEADVLCENGKIIEIEKNLKPKIVADKVIDATNNYVIPGGIDPHVHMHLPSPAGFSSDDFLTGSKAALAGGTTTFIDFVTPKKGQLLDEAIKERKLEASDCLINYSFHVSPIEWRDTIANEIKNCISNYGYISFKVYMAYKSSIGLDDDVLLKVMKTVAEAGGLLVVHCELGDEIEEIRNDFARKGKLSHKYHPLSRPSLLEAEAVKKAIDMAEETSCPLYIVHVSSSKSLKYISEAKKRGQTVYAETCPQYLLLDNTKYKENFNNSAAYIMSPPLREEEDNEALWKAISNGTINTLGTDHCPFTLEQKSAGKNDFRNIPNGAGGVEHRLTLLYTYGVLTKKITLNQFVALTSTNAAKIFQMYPSKGLIEIGSDADITIWDQKKVSKISSKTHKQNCDLNIYENIKIQGEPRFTIKNGEIINQSLYL